MRKIYEAVKEVLNFVKIWFMMLAQTDTGREFIQGISEQVQMIYNKSFANENTRITRQDMTLTVKKAMDLMNKYNINFDRLTKIVNNFTSFSKDKIQGMRLKDREKEFLQKYLKQLKKFGNEQNELYGKALDGWLARMLNSGDKFEKDFMDKKTMEVFIKSGYRIIKMVFLNTRIRVDTLQPGWNTKKKVSVVEAIKGLRMLKDSNTINVAFTYNNHTQYGDNDTYNQWINNVNILSTSGDFKAVNWDALEKNAILIDAKFKEHKYKEPKYLSDYE